MKRILVLCTGNSARSIIGEYLIRHLGAGRLDAVSAGSHPKGQPHPAAIAVLAAHGMDASAATSKSWDVFTAPDAPPIHIVITVCDNADREVCPAFPGRQVRAHWGIPDPAAVAGAGQMAAFQTAYRQLHARVTAMLALPLEDMDAGALQHALATIGAVDGGGDPAAL